MATDVFKVEVGASNNTSGCLLTLFIHYYYVMLVRQLHRWSSICRSDCGRDQRDCPTNWCSKTNHQPTTKGECCTSVFAHSGHGLNMYFHVLSQYMVVSSMISSCTD